jgi:hypothetical protein
MAQRPSIDMTKLTQADKIILGGAGLFFIWSFIPVWYKYSARSLFGISVPGGPVARVSGWHGITSISAILSILAIAWVIARVAGVNINLNFKPSFVDLGLAGLALLFTLLGLAVQPSFADFAWGLFVAIVLGLVWSYGAYMKYVEPAAMASPPPPPPTSPSTGGPTP